MVLHNYEDKYTQVKYMFESMFIILLSRYFMAAAVAFTNAIK